MLGGLPEMRIAQNPGCDNLPWLRAIQIGAPNLLTHMEKV
jgi:hypothetical protein